MKKIFTLILLVVLSFTLLACGNTQSDKDPKNNEVVKTTLALPNGTPALTSIFALTDKDHYKYDLLGGPSQLAPLFVKGDYDLIFAPTNMGMKVWNTGKENYQLAASMVNVNLFILNTKGVTTIDQIPDNTVISSFGQGLPPQIVLDGVKGTKQLDVQYESDIKNVVGKFLTKKVDYALLLEPLATVAQAKMQKQGQTVSRIPISQLYNQTNNTPNGLPFASLFVKKSLEQSKKDEIVKDFVEKAKKVTQANIDKVLEEVAKVPEITLPQPIIKQALSRSGLNPQLYNDSKDQFTKYLDIMFTTFKDSIGGKKPSDNFYFETQN